MTAPAIRPNTENDRVICISAISVLPLDEQPYKLLRPMPMTATYLTKITTPSCRPGLNYRTLSVAPKILVGVHGQLQNAAIRSLWLQILASLALPATAAPASDKIWRNNDDFQAYVRPFLAATDGDMFEVTPGHAMSVKYGDLDFRNSLVNFRHNRRDKRLPMQRPEVRMVVEQVLHSTAMIQAQTPGLEPGVSGLIKALQDYQHDEANVV